MDDAGIATRFGLRMHQLKTPGLGADENFAKFVAKFERAQRGEKFREIYSACVLR